MNVTETVLPGVLVIDPDVYKDPRGFFLESWNEKKYQEIGINLPFVQDNTSRSTVGVLRGLHFQVNKPQGKLVRVSQGCVFDVAADINPASPTFGQYVGIELSDDNHRQLYIRPDTPMDSVYSRTPLISHTNVLNFITPVMKVG